MTEFQIKADGRIVPVATTRVYNWRNPRPPQSFAEGTPEAKLAEHFHFNYASYAHLECEDEAEIEILLREEPTADAGPILRPLSYGIEPEVAGKTIRFTIRPGQQVSVEPYDDTGPVLHLFADVPEEDVPDADDPNVLYFGPGVHERAKIELHDNQTLYLAPGAVLKATIADNEPFERLEHRGPIMLHHLDHFISAWDAENITIRGRGIIDTSDIANAFARKNPISLNRCKNVRISGITILDATCWTITLYRCRDCLVENIKQISAFFNSDGVNTVSSQNVVVRNCFLRNRDDGISVKAMDTGNKDCFLVEPEAELPGGEVDNVLVENCVIWSDWGYAFGATYEIRKPIRNITIRNCDVIHATHPGGQGVIGVLVSDRDHVSDVLFEDIRVERTLKALIDLRIRVTPWTVDPNLGTIHDITFRKVELYQPPPHSGLAACARSGNRNYTSNYQRLLDDPRNLINLTGLSAESNIRAITFDDVTVAGSRITSASQMQTNPFVSDIRIERPEALT